MFLNDVLNKCKEEGHPITRQGLYQAGKKYGFLTKVEGKKELDFDQEKFLEWLKVNTSDVPKNCYTINELVHELEISYMQLYSLIRDNNIPYVSRFSKKYYDLNDVMSIIKKDVPEGWKSVKELAESFSCSIPQIYLLLNEVDKTDKKKISGLIYANTNRLEEIIEQRKNSHKYNW